MNGHVESLHYGKSCKMYENKIKSPKSMFFFVFSKVWLPGLMFDTPGLDGEADE